MIDIIFLTFIIVSAYTDLKYRKIYNALSISGIILGFGTNIVNSGFAGFSESLIGLISGGLFLIIFYVLGGVGAGDVKFMAAVGSIKGVEFVLIGGCYGAVFGGIAAIILLIYKRKMIYTLGKIYSAYLGLRFSKKTEALNFKKEDTILLPYAAFLSAGMLIRWVETVFKQ